MANFQVPQFIEEKAKIIGPLTLVQFGYLATAGTISVLSFYMFGGFLWFLITVLVASLAIVLAFAKINGQSLATMVVAAAKFWQKPKTYIWTRETKYTTFDVSDIEKIQAIRQDMGLQERIKNATLGVVTGVMPLLRGEKSRLKKGGDYQVVTYATGERKVARRIDY